MYQTIAQDYDRFVNWQARLAFEIPFIEEAIRDHFGRLPGSPAILDVACGTGMHAIALAKLGYQVSGMDYYPEMIQKAVQNSQIEGVNVDFKVAGFDDLDRTYADESFDAVLCLGNSLPHVKDKAELEKTLSNFHKVLNAGGPLILQNRNFDRVMKTRQRWMDPQSFSEGDREWIFQRFYDFEPGGWIRFNMVTLKRQSPGGWQAQVAETMLLPLTSDLLLSALEKVGFRIADILGSLSHETYDPDKSENLVMLTNKG